MSTSARALDTLLLRLEAAFILPDCTAASRNISLLGVECDPVHSSQGKRCLMKTHESKGLRRAASSYQRLG